MPGVKSQISFVKHTKRYWSTLLTIEFGKLKVIHTAVVYRSDTSSVGVIYKTCHPSQTTPTLFYWELAIPL